MEKQEHKSSWDELARELGADVPAETEQREQAIVAAAPESSPPTVSRPAQAATVSPPAPKRAAPGWDKLASDLGLPPVEPAAPMAEERPSPPKPVSRTPPVERPPRESRPPAERSDSRQPAERREPRSKQPESRDRRRERSERPRPERAAPAPVRSKPEREKPVEVEASAPPSAQLSEESAKPASVSLWHKIFGLPAEQSAKLSDAPPSAGRSEERWPRSNEPEQAFDAESIRSISGGEVTVAGSKEGIDFDEGSDRTSEESASEELKRGRSRRRRRGGRGRTTGERDEGRRSGPRKLDPDRELLDVAGDDDFDDLGVVGAQEDDAADEDDDQLNANGSFDDEIDDDADVNGQESSRSKAAQRTIPSWDEAIGFIVDSNMQSRSQRRPPSRGSSRNNSSRGRSRGRRRG